MAKRHLQPNSRNSVSIAPKVPDPRRTPSFDETGNSPAPQYVSDPPSAPPKTPATTWLNLYVRFADAVTLLASFAAIALAVLAIWRAWPLITSDTEPKAAGTLTASPKPEISSPSPQPAGVQQ
jgi:hypothetical protein